MNKESRSQKEEHYVNLYRAVYGSNAGLYTETIRKMTEGELEECIKILSHITNKMESCLVSWTNDELREQLKDNVFGREPTEAELQEFKEFLDRDAGQWLADNIKAFNTKLGGEGRI